ncbi:hypothetical protein GCM10010434_068760 [Winogradskya humida]
MSPARLRQSTGEGACLALGGAAGNVLRAGRETDAEADVLPNPKDLDLRAGPCLRFPIRGFVVGCLLHTLSENRLHRGLRMAGGAGNVERVPRAGRFFSGADPSGVWLFFENSTGC